MWGDINMARSSIPKIFRVWFWSNAQDTTSCTTLCHKFATWWVVSGGSVMVGHVRTYFHHSQLAMWRVVTQSCVVSITHDFEKKVEVMPTHKVDVKKSNGIKVVIHVIFNAVLKKCIEKNILKIYSISMIWYLDVMGQQTDEKILLTIHHYGIRIWELHIMYVVYDHQTSWRVTLSYMLIELENFILN